MPSTHYDGNGWVPGQPDEPLDDYQQIPVHPDQIPLVDIPTNALEQPQETTE